MTSRISRRSPPGGSAPQPELSSGRVWRFSPAVIGPPIARTIARLVPCGAARSPRSNAGQSTIDDSDLDSKSTFTLLAQLLELQSGDVKAAGPLLTLPVGT